MVSGEERRSPLVSLFGVVYDTVCTARKVVLGCGAEEEALHHRTMTP